MPSRPLLRDGADITVRAPQRPIRESLAEGRRPPCTQNMRPEAGPAPASRRCEFPKGYVADKSCFKLWSGLSTSRSNEGGIHVVGVKLGEVLHTPATDIKSRNALFLPR